MKKKSLFRKVLSLICCVAMCLTTLAPVVDAATATPGKVLLVINDDVEFITDFGEQMTSKTAEGLDPEGSNYGCVYNEVDGTIELTCDAGSWSTGNVITFYAKVTDNRSIKMDSSNVSAGSAVVTTDYSFGANQKIVVTVAKRFSTYGLLLTAEVEKPKYDVTFQNGDCTFMNDLGTATLKGGSFEEGSEIKFKLNGVQSGKNVEIRENSVPLSVGEGSNLTYTDGVYTYKVSKDATITAVLKDITHKVTIPTAEKQTTYTIVSSDGKYEVVAGGTFTFYVNPKEGNNAIAAGAVTAKIGDETVNVNKVGETTYTINDIDGDVVISVDAPEAKQYNANYANGTGYTITSNNGHTVQHGSSFAFTVGLTDGYKITSAYYTVNGARTNFAQAAGIYTIDDVTGDINIVITAEQETYKVEVKKETDDVKATITAPNGSAVAHGAQYTFYVTPAVGDNDPIVTKKVVGKADEVLKPVSGNQYVTEITAGTTITVKDGETKTFNVIFRSGVGFTHKDATTVKCNHGGSYEGNITVGDAYSNSAVVITVNGTPVDVTKSDNTYSYKIENITADQVVAVNALTMNSYKVTLTPGAGYTLTAIGDTTVSYGGDFSFRLELASGYKDAVVKVGDKEYEPDGDVYTIKEIKENITVNVTVGNVTYTATVNNDENDHATVKSVSGNDANSISYNGDYSFEVGVDVGYRLVSVSVNGGEIKPINGVYTVHGVQRNVTIVVETVANKLTVNYVSNVANHAYTGAAAVSYTYAELASAELPKLPGCAIHNDGAWYNGDDTEVTSLEDLRDRIETSDDAVTLTAKFDVNADKVEKILNLAKTSAELTKLADGKYRVTFRTAISDLSEDPCVAGLVTVTAYGTMLANNPSFDPKSVDLSKGTNVTAGSYNGVKVVDGNGEVYLYYVKSDTSWNDFKAALEADLTVKTNEVILRVNNVKNPAAGALNAAGWIELTIGGKKYTVISAASGVDYIGTLAAE